jgi:hypothetical protein
MSNQGLRMRERKKGFVNVPEFLILRDYLYRLTNHSGLDFGGSGVSRRGAIVPKGRRSEYGEESLDYESYISEKDGNDSQVLRNVAQNSQIRAATRNVAERAEHLADQMENLQFEEPARSQATSESSRGRSRIQKWTTDVVPPDSDDEGTVRDCDVRRYRDEGSAPVSERGGRSRTSVAPSASTVSRSRAESRYSEFSRGTASTYTASTRTRMEGYDADMSVLSGGTGGTLASRRVESQAGGVALGVMTRNITNSRRSDSQNRSVASSRTSRRPPPSRADSKLVNNQSYCS